MVALHEGGYSELYVPFCGLAVLEAMSGKRTEVQVGAGERGKRVGGGVAKGDEGKKGRG